MIGPPLLQIYMKETRDLLDMGQYRVEKLPKRNLTTTEQWLVKVGIPIAILVFAYLAWFADLSFLWNFEPSGLAKVAAKHYKELGHARFLAANRYLFALFAMALVLWITEAIPNYLTSLILIVSLVLTGVLEEESAYAQLGHPVMWLNIMSFVLASMLVTTGVAKRFALWFIVKFGKNATTVFISFIIINTILSAFISATTAKAAILLPIFMVVAAIYGARPGNGRNNFGRNLVLQNLFCINIGASGFLTGSGANLLGASLIAGAIGSQIFYSEWLIAAFPVAIGLMVLGWWIGSRIVFPLSKEEQLPQIEGGMERLKEELKKLGPMSGLEIRSLVLFGLILLFWATDKFHGISPTAVSFVGAIIALLPRVGIVKWNDVDIPWHLLLFSAGAYTLGEAFKVTDLPSTLVGALFSHLGLGVDTHFWVFYVILTAAMIFSALLFQSKTMRVMIFVPIAIGVANNYGFSVMSLALPVALLAEHVYVLPFNSKPAALLFLTDHYSLPDTFKFGFTMMVIAWFLNLLLGETWFRFLEITPNGVFGLW